MPLARLVQGLRRLRDRAILGGLRRRALRQPRNSGGIVRLGGMEIGYSDLLSLYVEYKDIFLHRIYHFSPERAAPTVIDGGSCIGVSLLYFKRAYPDSKVLCFEPDPQLFELLGSNVRANRLENVTLVQAGLSDREGTAEFLSDGSDGGRIVEAGQSNAKISLVRLSQYIDAPVDFLKLNIEGQELPVLRELEAAGKLRHVRRMVLEYHGWAHGEQRLGAILDLLDRNGFRYVVHDFDAETCPASKPPFAPRKDTTWFCLIAAAQAT